MPRISGSPALSKLRILDLTRVRAGPTCVRQFADFGADVIKIENTTVGNLSGVIWVGGTPCTARAGLTNQTNGGTWTPTVSIPQVNFVATAGVGPAVGFKRDDKNAGTNNVRSGDPNPPWGGPFPQGGLFCWCDGTVRMVAYSTSSASNQVTSLGSYLTPTNGEAATLPD